MPTSLTLRRNATFPTLSDPKIPSAVNIFNLSSRVFKNTFSDFRSAGAHRTRARRPPHRPIEICYKAKTFGTHFSQTDFRQCPARSNFSPKVAFWFRNERTHTPHPTGCPTSPA